MATQQKMESEMEPAAASRPAKRHYFKLPDGQLYLQSEWKTISKFDRDVINYYYGTEKKIVPATGKKKERVEWITEYDPDNPLMDKPLLPGGDSPVCQQCALHEHKCQNPFMPYYGSKTPLVTIIFEGVTRAEDRAGRLSAEGSPATIRNIIEKSAKETGVELKDIRWVPMTRCANWLEKTVNFKSKGNWCRYHVVDDLRRHPPTLIMPVGTAALGLLSHKSNAQEWSGRLLTFRGWPDDWLSNPKYSLPRSDPRGKTVTGHPLFGPVPDLRVPMVPIQAPRLISAQQNPVVRKRWIKDILRALSMAKDGVAAPNYMRKWYRWTGDVKVIEQVLNELMQHPGIELTYDTETTGLRGWADNAAIVSIMFRWVDPLTGQPCSLGFPWDYEGSPVRQHIPWLKKLVWKVLTHSILIGHNLTFDMLYTFATFWKTSLAKGWSDRDFNLKRDKWITRLANACRYDTWHMAFALQQRRGSLGLEALAYDWVPDLAGYEEDMTILIDLRYDEMHPAANKGGHYLNCPRDKWESHLTPYVMGDVEVCHQAHQKIRHKLEDATLYEFPLAHSTKPGQLRLYQAPGRGWVYSQIMSPAAQTLMKVMARGLYIDEQSLSYMENNMPKTIMELRSGLKSVNPLIEAWCNEQKALDSKWELDLENKGQLKDLLFKCLNLPVVRLTKQGRALYGDNIDEAHGAVRKALLVAKSELKDNPADLQRAVQEHLRKFAAVDKFTLNKICADFDYLRPLQKYRKAFKLYSTYVRPLRNAFTSGLDKKHRTEDQHLCFDQCLHASFLLTGTRGGRLSCRCLPLRTKVCTQRGVVDLATVRPGDLIQTSTGPRRVMAFALTGNKKTLAFRTQSGRTLECSPDHLLFSEGAWKRAADLRTGDSLYLCAQKAPDSLPTTSLEAVDFFDAKNKQSKSVRLPPAMSDSVAFVMGHYIAEGCIGFNKVRPSVNRNRGGNQTGSYRSARAYPRLYATGELVPCRVILAHSLAERRDLMPYLAGMYRRLFGVRGRYVKMGKSKSPAYVVNSKQLACWFLAQGCGGYSNEKHVPTAIWRASLRHVLAFLRGLFEGDGSASSRGGFLSTDSRTLADETVLLLARLGIHAGCSVARRKNGVLRYRVAVYRESRAQAAALFWSQRKKIQLKPDGTKGRSGVRQPHGKPLRVAAKGLAAWRINTGRTKFISPSVLQQFSRCWTGESAAFAAWAQTANARSDLIVEVQERAAQAMCDITVEGGDFLVNGIRLHNSPNLQQLPRDGEIKQMFVSRFGERGCMYQGDLSQIELRLMAAACGDPTMVKAYFDDIDLHSLTASRIYNTPYEHFTKEYMKELQDKGRDEEAKKLELKRVTAKTVNFLTGYGGGAFGLQNVLAMRDIYMSPEECKDIIDAFFRAYPALKKLLQEYKRFILDNHVAVSIFGRVRVFEEVRGNDEEAKAKALRAGCNHLIQSTASDMMLTALTCIEGLMRGENLESVLVSTVHDSLVIDAVREELPVVHNIVNDVLNNFPDVLKAMFGDNFDTSWMLVPFTSDAEVGLNLLDMKKLPKKNVDWDKLLSGSS